MESKFPNRWFPLLVLLPTLIVCGVFLYYPVAQSFSWSLLRSAFMGLRTLYVGPQNYVRLFTSSAYLRSLWVSVLFAGGVVIFGLTFSLAIALLPTERYVERASIGPPSSGRTPSPQLWRGRSGYSCSIRRPVS